ncbi:hypothetical protein PACID_00490 [Acidipropionibacterium acidipropionici ATCC 4875]|uniref:Uncharacterized protein n=1 Tax=Acidipropionibacterium acidipropionici (strain ATCC 4875 / DSM 20272 / JCM 6432 / NBRC 12425 / NCIMB 8070 / 4) TaxID=1171373 RepID=K7SF46_ACIA4|nr:hypothetical protein PACID_00490 [Acidipropionibacterium acidipropionici ATCC 4875]
MGHLVNNVVGDGLPILRQMLMGRIKSVEHIIHRFLHSIGTA